MKIGIVGLGLIGGSLGLDLSAQGYEVIGVSRQQITCQKALEKAIVKSASLSLKALTEVDIIFICTPINEIISTVKELIIGLNPNTIITDVGSVKTPIVETCTQLWPNFLGGHPMAGTAQQGVESAQKGLFVNAPYVLTPTQTTPKWVINRAVEVIKTLEAKIYYCDPEKHDQAVAWISHLPVMISASLINACLTESNSQILDLAQQLASSGFRDTSRVGGGNPELGLMMASSNRQGLLRALFQYRQTLDILIDHIDQKQWDNLNDFLHQAQENRNNFNINP